MRAAQDSTALCYGVLGAFQLWVGFLIPVAVVAFTEARWFAKFEREVAERRRWSGAQTAQHWQHAQQRAAENGGTAGAGSKGGAGRLGALYRWLNGGPRSGDALFVGPATAILLAAAAWEVVTNLLRP